MVSYLSLCSYFHLDVLEVLGFHQLQLFGGVFLLVLWNDVPTTLSNSSSVACCHGVHTGVRYLQLGVDHLVVEFIWVSVPSLQFPDHTLTMLTRNRFNSHLLMHALELGLLLLVVFSSEDIVLVFL